MTRRWPLLSSCLLALLLPGCGGGGGDGGSDGGTTPSTANPPTTPSTPSTPPVTQLPAAGDGGIINEHTIELAAASHLGATDDALAATVITNDGLVLGGTVTDTADLTITELHPGDGVLVKLAADGLSQLAGVSVGSSVTDLAIASAAGPIAICGSDVVGLLAADWSAFTWRLSTGADRIAYAGGIIAAVANKTLTAWQEDGTERFSLTLTDSDVADVAVHGPTGHIIVTGYNQVSNNLKTPYLRAYTDTGAVAWQVYQWSNSEVSGASLGADSEGRRLAIGADGQLYLAASTDGGNSVFARQPDDLGTNAGLTTPDVHQQAVNLSGSARLAFIGRYDPNTGSLLGGTWLLARLTSGKQNTIHIRDIAADSTGAVAVVGVTRWAIAHRDDLLVNDVSTIGAGQYLCLFTPTFQRTAWTVFGTTDGSGGTLGGVAFDGTRVVMAGADPADQQVTVGAIGSATSGAWFGVLNTIDLGGAG